jgi:hypothetical protein
MARLFARFIGAGAGAHAVVPAVGLEDAPLVILATPLVCVAQPFETVEIARYATAWDDADWA